MLLMIKNKKGSFVLEATLVFPLVVLMILMFVMMQMAVLETSVLNQTTAEMAKVMAAGGMGEEALAALLVELTGLPSGLLVGGDAALSREDSIGFLMRMDDSGLLCADRVESVYVGRQEGYYRAKLVYRSAFIPGMLLDSRAMERSWGHD